MTLPEYLGRPGALQKDVRGGTISLVEGSRPTFTATASRELSTAKVNGQPQTPVGRHGHHARRPPVKGPRKMEFRWQDTFGLEGKEPFTLAINGRDDEAPSLACEDLPRQKVVLDSEVLSFKIHAQDDFGVKRVGMEWQGIDNPVVTKPAKGERILGRGRPGQGGARAGRHLLGQVAGHRAAAGAGPDVRRGLPPRPRPGVLAALHVLRAQRPSSTRSGSPSS